MHAHCVGGQGAAARSIQLLLWGLLSFACGCGQSFEEGPEGPSDATWSLSFGDTEQQMANAVAVDAAGNVYIAGALQGTADFGGGVLTSAGGADIYVASFDTNGNHRWSVRFGDQSTQYASAIALDPAGNVLVGAVYSGTVEFAGNPIIGDNWDAIVLKLSAAGGEMFALPFIGSGRETLRAMQVDSAGNIFVAGTFDADIDLGGGVYSAVGGMGREDVFIAKLLPDGEHVWSRSFGDQWQDQVSDLSVDSLGNVAATGFVQGAVDFGAGETFGTGAMVNDDAFIVSYKPDGSVAWALRFGDDFSQRGAGVAHDAQDNLLAIGYFAGDIDFGAGPRGASSGYDVYVAKLSAGGAPVWDQSHGVSGNQYGFAIGTDPQSNIIIAGDFQGAVDFTGEELRSFEDTRDIFVAQIAPDGTPRSSHSYGGAFEQHLAGLAADAAGHAIIVGSFEDNLDLGFEPHSSSGEDDADAYVAKLAP